MRTNHNYVVKAQVPAAGTYHLYVRSHGKEGTAFRVAVGERVIQQDVGDEPLKLERVGTFQLERGMA